MLEWFIPLEIKVASMLFHMIYDPCRSACEWIYKRFSQRTNGSFEIKIYHDDMWQTPVITEKRIKELLSEVDVSNSIITGSDNVKTTYISFPWATYIDIMSQKAMKEKEKLM